MTLLRVPVSYCLRFCLSIWTCAACSSLIAESTLAQTRYAQSEFPEAVDIQPLPSESILDTPTEIAPPPALPDTVPESIVVSAFEVIGSTVFSESDLAKITAPYLNRPLTPADLFEVRSAITQRYVDQGYVNSGAYIPPQTLTDGILQIQVLEGQLTDINVTIDGRLSPNYVRSRLALAGSTPLNSERLLEGLRLLQLDPLIQNITAELATGTEPGTSILDVEVTVADTFDVELRTDNNRSPSVGSWRRGIALTEDNLLGQGDPLELEYLNTSGSDEISLDYAFPINARNGTIGWQVSLSDSSVIEDPFTFLDIQSESQTYGVSFRQPLVQTPNEELALGLRLTHQRSKTDFLGDVIGESVGFPSPGADAGGRTRLSALRFSQEWTQTGNREVLALFSEFSLGLDLLDATVNDNAPDSQFFAWRGQAQWVKLLAPETLLLLKGSLQLSGDDLLPLEEFGLGGQQTVRGYRQNVLLTDNGLSLSGEVRLPVYRARNIDGLLQLAPFVDVGSGWNHNGPNPDPNVLVSTGIGLLWRQGDRLTARLDWGIPLVDIDKRTSSLQENGLYFAINYRLF
ncbi:ShlB/FhaC/HecB family hemolysin secretion/activation protein [Leptothoe spongobia]|uniref:ShlB/FhaC/HecB family hemolysin secretion/activation protein n=1 Tax=Leptothoe spongobia TAU-MAC 1115 TaxID=1967444 RepID=A0A947DFI5_9CYAN|nr:ShlB/FhaC/HecB family hemolysin secretion/activation protein [Leptothoe spongobia]MBT9315946.1 ShlB/FhaC/HecB family hemolysin secretion/activation protein [Leptothoe spongobia TAU-MAC 1115]